MFIKNKRKAKYISALAVAITLALTSCQKKEKPIASKIESIEENRQEEQKNFKLKYCEVIIENYPDGSVKHHFITDCDYEMYVIDKTEKENYTQFKYKYKAITDENLVFRDLIIYYNGSNQSYEEIPETNGSYIFDYNIPYFKMHTWNLKLPEGYSLDADYSASELKELEEKLDASLYNNRIEKSEYYPSAILLAKVADEYMCFDASNLFGLDYITETTNIEEETKLKKFVYLPSIEKNTINLKFQKVTEVDKNHIVFNALEQNYAFIDITSLDQTLRNDLRKNQIVFKDFSDYLTYEQKDNPTITEEEIIELLNKLNSKEHKLEEKLEELTETNMTKNTSFSVPDSTNIWLHNLNCIDLRAFKDLSKKQNPVSSYFGDSIDRCISSICLTDGENEINVNNIEECEYYLSEGYEVIGYSYINIYATSKEDREIYVPIESAKLIHTPFE